MTEFGVMLFFTIAGMLIVAGATRLHRVLGIAVLVPVTGFVLLLAVGDAHLVSSLISAFFIWSAHLGVLPQNRSGAADAPGVVAAVPEPPVLGAPAPDARPATACPGCGAGVRPGGTCAYCGRHV